MHTMTNQYRTPCTVQWTNLYQLCTKRAFAVNDWQSIAIATNEADLHPWLLMQVCDVKLAAWRMRHQLVMLLQNLVEALQ